MKFGKHKTRAHSHYLRHTISMTKVDGSPVLITLWPSSTISQEKACHLQHPNCARTCKISLVLALMSAKVTRFWWHISANKLLKYGSQYFPLECKILWVLPGLYGYKYTEYYWRLSFSWQEAETLAAHEEMKRDMYLTVLKFLFLHAKPKDTFCIS